MRRLSLLLLIALATGCDSAPDRVATHPVSGKIIYDGKPAAGVQVYLFPTSAPMRPQIPSNPRGTTGPDGSFTISTYGEGDGAAEGGYQVILLWPAEKKESEEEGEDADQDRLLGWYTAVHSQLTAQIKPGQNQLPTFILPFRKTPPGAVEGIPGRN